MSSYNPTQIQWQKYENELKLLSIHMKKSLIYSSTNKTSHIEYYFCSSVMDLSRFLRNQTKAFELGSQHHTLKILFKFLKYGDDGVVEYPVQDGRADIYLEHGNRIIEVKTITQMTFQKLYNKILGVLDAEPLKADILWVFYFYKLKQSSPLAPNCQYLLTFISIDLIDVEQGSLKWDLSRMIEDSKIEVAEKLRMSPELIIPLENLLKVEDLERELAEEKQKVAERDQKIAELTRLLKKYEN